MLFPKKPLTCYLAAAMSAALWAQTKEAEIRAHLDRGAKAQEREDFQAAANEYKKAVDLDAGNAEAHARLGMAYNHLGKLAEATESLERALRFDPNLRGVKVLVAFNYIAAGRCRDAVPLLAASFEKESNPQVRLVTGQRLVECCFATGEEERALAIVQELRQMAPDDPDVLYAALKAYMGSWNAAFERLMNKAPDSYRTHQVLAESLAAQERFADAANEYRRIIKLVPQLPGMHYQLGRMILRSDPSPEGEQKALAEFQKELEIASAAPALAEVAEIYLRRQTLAEASRHFSRAVQLQPRYVPARVGLAKVFIAEKQWPKALEQLEAAAKVAPNDEAVAYNLMLTYRGLGRTADAKRANETFQRLKEQNQKRRSPLANPTGGAPTSSRTP